MYTGKKKLKRVERIGVVFNGALKFCCLCVRPRQVDHPAPGRPPWPAGAPGPPRAPGPSDGPPSWWNRWAVTGFPHLLCNVRRPKAAQGVTSLLDPDVEVRTYRAPRWCVRRRVSRAKPAMSQPPTEEKRRVAPGAGPLGSSELLVPFVSWSRK